MAVTIWNRVSWGTRSPSKIGLENGDELSTDREFIHVKDASNALIAVFSGANVYGASMAERPKRRRWSRLKEDTRIVPG